MIISLASNIFNSCGVSTKAFEITSSIELTGIIFNLFLKSSKTSIALIGLKFDEMFALGIARGKFKNLSIDLTTLFLGNLIATVLKFAVTDETIFEFLWEGANLQSHPVADSVTLSKKQQTYEFLSAILVEKISDFNNLV